ncbi:MAG: hypothetical protein M0P01_04860 [Treponema sp.]|nr:hypothetical protein [Treponema sp.]
MVLLKNKFIFAAVFLMSVSCALFAAERPIVTDISASSGTGKFITITWTLPLKPEQPVTSLLVFRDIKPIASYSQLGSLKPATSLNSSSTSWSDQVENYIDYYYAVIAVIGSGQYNIIIPSMNATVNGAHRRFLPQKIPTDTSASAKEKLYPQGTMRETPLPYIDLVEGMNTSGSDIGKQAREQAELLGEKKSGQQMKLLDVYIFEEDLISPEAGDDYFLFDALKSTFIRKKYKESAATLRKLLGTNRSENVTKRAKFYLAESYYFSGNYQEAVKTFLAVSDKYPALTKKWIDSSLDLMAAPVQ